MFSLFSRPRRAAAPRRAPLSLECLSARDLPSGTIPVIKDFEADELSNGIFRISGRVEDDQPAGLTVTLGGGLTGVSGQTTTTASDGSFSITVFVGTLQSGMATAFVTDDDEYESDLVDVNIRPTPWPEEDPSGDGGGD